MSDSDLRSLLEQVKTDRAATTKSLKMSLGIVIFLNIFALGYMTWIKVNLAKFDARELTHIVSTRVVEQMPQWREQAETELIAAAPKVTEQALQTLLAAPRKFRIKMEEGIRTKLRDNIHAFESAMDARLEGLTEQRIEELRLLYPEGTDQDRLDQFLADALKNYKDNVRSALEAVYGDFSTEAERLDDYMLLLQNNTKLSDEEKLHREILQTWVVLVEKHKAEQSIR